MNRKGIPLPVIGLALLLIVFIAIKIPYLDLPFYWDEAWVYAKAVRAMHEQGISLLPDAIPPELSRGHPLLFHALAAAWMSVFGDGRIAMHAFPLAVSCGLLTAVFGMGRLLGSAWLGLVAACLVAVTEIFLAQSGLLLPEVLLALFCVLAATACISRRAWAYVACMTAALLTKESALACWAAIVAQQVIRRCLASEAGMKRSEMRWLAWAALPIAPALLYFVVQRIMLGWFLYPEHTGMLTWAPIHINYKAKLIFKALFEDQGFVWLTYAIGLAAPLLIRTLAIHWRLLAAFLGIAAIKVLFGRWTLPYGPGLLVAAAALAGLYAAYVLHLQRRYGQAGELVSTCFLIMVSFWSFNALNFYTDRYLVAMTPFIAVGATGAIALAARGWLPRLEALLPLPFVLVIALHIGRDGAVGDCRLAYREAIAVHQEMAAYLESEGLQDESIHGSFMDVSYLSDPLAGYLSQGRAFTHVSNQLDADTRYAIVDYSSGSERRTELAALGFSTIKRFERGPAWSELMLRPPSR
ncbi:MAG: hypothetical protein QY325_03495 [Flavobacteriales bacterium]|jgi:hypothetical protein|nr:MAG: hypothetical protein QY325_03495 [Flavobacteriales bacterium]